MGNQLPRPSKPGVSRQRRLLYAFSAFVLAAGMYDAATFGVWSPRSLSYAAASLTGLREWLSLGYAACAGGMLPFIAAQCRRAPPPHWTLAMLGASCVAAALMWVGEAFADRHVDFEMLFSQHLRYAAQALVYAILVAANYNANKLAGRNLNAGCQGKRGSNKVPLK